MTLVYFIIFNCKPILSNVRQPFYREFNNAFPTPFFPVDSFKVQPGEGNRAAFNDMRALSGGERSFSTVCFILSLWSIAESPFRCLDEFDVYMVVLHFKFSSLGVGWWTCVLYGSDSLFSFTRTRKAPAPTLQSVLVEGRTEELQFSPCYDMAAPETRPDFLLFSPSGTSLLSTRWTSCSLFPSVFPSFIVTESQKQLAYAFLPSQPLREQLYI